MTRDNHRLFLTFSNTTDVWKEIDIKEFMTLIGEVPKNLQNTSSYNLCPPDDKQDPSKSVKTMYPYLVY